ncbi:hypothetical protein D9Q98_001350 [Chlorella vulgaris]|uniref:FAD dependent oxidoreductase domain-containing protein n=1 Tax=Chlorella vulgaris TaxID=3077 RepID=A0A9D4TZQ0_CHLVU|nr:hypothetical protein D9Q98_001350 [Chlorella vulgaris]
MSSHVWDVVIVGAGGAHGSAAVYALAKRGIQVLGLEAQPSAPHGFGSSHGSSRIIRSAYHEHPSYVPLLRESFRLWRALERDSGDNLLTMTGCINASVPGAGHVPGAGLSCFEGALRSAQENILPHEVLSSQQVAARYPAYRLPPESKSLYEQEGGVLAPERCIAAQLRLAQAHGARLVFGAKVTSWQVLPSFSGSGSSTGSNSSSSGSGGNQGLVQVCSSRGTFLARRLVLAAGAWTPALVPELASILEVERQVVGWFSVAPEKRHNFAAEASAAACASQHLWLVKEGAMAQRGKRMPAFLLQDAAGYYYGFPADEHGFKIGKYHHRLHASKGFDPGALEDFLGCKGAKILIATSICGQGMDFVDLRAMVHFRVLSSAVGTRQEIGRCKGRGSGRDTLNVLYMRATAIASQARKSKSSTSGRLASSAALEQGFDLLVTLLQHC